MIGSMNRGKIFMPKCIGLNPYFIFDKSEL